MANIFTITSADIRDILASDSAYQELITDARYGGQIDPQSAIDQGVARFLGYCGGAFTAPANLAVARPFAADFALHAIHLVKANSNASYKIPDTVAEARQAAMAWARTSGAALIAAEGTAIPGSGSVEYVSPDPDFDMDQLDHL